MSSSSLSASLSASSASSRNYLSTNIQISIVIIVIISVIVIIIIISKLPFHEHVPLWPTVRGIEPESLVMNLDNFYSIAHINCCLKQTKRPLKIPFQPSRKQAAGFDLPRLSQDWKTKWLRHISIANLFLLFLLLQFFTRALGIPRWSRDVWFLVLFLGYKDGCTWPPSL